ncbi:MAG: DUF4386 family protein [Acidimicrobiales bacterium]
MTSTLTHSRHHSSVERRSAKAGGIGALIATATFIFGIALLATTMSDYSTGDPTPAESVAFEGDHATIFFLWYLVIFLVFGAAIIPLARALHGRLHSASPLLADIGAVFAYIWAGLMFATGMISNIGISAVEDLASTNPVQAEALWSSIDAVTNGLGGGNELVGGMWVLLVSLAAWATNALPRALNALGIISAISGLITVIPGLEDVGIVFGLGLIIWFAWVGVVLLRSDSSTSEQPGNTLTNGAAR